MANQTLASVPNGIEYDVVYPASGTDPESMYKGGNDIVRYVRESHAACPNQKFALLGYSQGASVVLLALHEFGLNDYFINAVVMIENPIHKKYQISTIDKNGGNSTSLYDGTLYFIFSEWALTERLANDGRVLDICYLGSSVCSGLLISPAHFLYPANANVQRFSTEHLVAKLRG